MARKKWTPREQSPDIIDNREKRKWQIALRRYVFLQSPCTYYAPFFGLGAQKLREWVNVQFEEGMNWENFSKEWYFGHVLSPSFFEFNKEEEMKLCWNFLNISVVAKNGEQEFSGLAQAKQYYRKLLAETGEGICPAMLKKIEAAESSSAQQFEKRISFTQNNRDYINTISGFDAYQLEQLNGGMPIEEIIKEKELMRNF